MGTATANSILVVSYARERIEIHGNALKAALEAGIGRIRPVLMTALAMIVGSLLIGRIVYAWELRRVTQSGAIEDVAVLTPKPADPMVSITLPGTIDAWYSARIYPQVSGYVKMWFKDFGADVQAGDLMAEINAPGLDAQYAQAKADLSAAEAKYNLSVVTAKRWQAMGKSQSVSGQTVSISVANMKSQQASLEAAQHNVDRFAALEKFKSIVAPFSGVVTARNISVGELCAGWVRRYGCKGRRQGDVHGRASR